MTAHSPLAIEATGPCEVLRCDPGRGRCGPWRCAAPLRLRRARAQRSRQDDDHSHAGDLDPPPMPAAPGSLDTTSWRRPTPFRGAVSLTGQLALGLTRISPDART